MTKITIIDYGMGNVQSVRNAFEFLGCQVTITNEPSQVLKADALILPGVGAFGEAMKNLHHCKLLEPIQRMALEEKKPLLGICLGMQLLADSSVERGEYAGLSLIPGQVKPIPTSNHLRLPHIGWNNISLPQKTSLFNQVSDGDSFYFVHSYYFSCDASYISSETDYGGYLAASVQHENVFGVQFHPERSHHKGLGILRNFVNIVDSSHR